MNNFEVTDADFGSLQAVKDPQALGFVFDEASDDIYCLKKGSLVVIQAVDAVREHTLACLY